jgi:hypothetical protein
MKVQCHTCGKLLERTPWQMKRNARLKQHIIVPLLELECQPARGTCSMPEETDGHRPAIDGGK